MLVSRRCLNAGELKGTDEVGNEEEYVLICFVPDVVDGCLLWRCIAIASSLSGHCCLEGNLGLVTFTKTHRAD